ncbi:nucleotidyltransferase domain-containing protein [Tumebacillus sp. BK434]|uniref:nucleotidyltransferase domain-containing protein n=1 Tax=Tumebacillus sp. BK434 TaxID=2512169 RepID=UPI001FB22B60|nr:nucleotidyltransferase domain-containing protein [Tumebacillus sp. BK434]
MPMLETYNRLLQAASFAEAVHGVYLYGSIALGAYEAATSDIDFITVLKREFTSPEREELERLHHRLQTAHPLASRMDGMYIALPYLGRLNPDIPAYCFTHAGEFHRAGHWDINHVTWWLLQHRGITIAGPDASTLPLAVRGDDLHAAMMYNLHSYWPRRLQLLEGMEAADPADIADAVLTLCRIAYTLAHRDILSKPQALQHALDTADEKWHGLLRDTMRIQSGGEVAEFSSADGYAQTAAAFIRAVIDAHPPTQGGGLA